MGWPAVRLVWLLALTAGVVAFTQAAIATDPIKIGIVAPLTGPFAESGRYQTQGARLAADEINKAGGLLGRPLELVTEDDQSTNPGIVLAFSKLAGNAELVGFLGSIRSTQIHAMAPDVPQNRQAGGDGRHRSGAHSYGQSLVVPVSSE